MLKKERAEDESGVTCQAHAWPEEEIRQSRFRDERLGKRFRLVLERLWSCMGQSIPMAFQDWCSTKAAYRFFSNPKVNEQEILSGHFEVTRKRFGVSKGPVAYFSDGDRSLQNYRDR